MKFKFLSMLTIASALFCSCSEETPGIGQSIYENELIDAQSTAYQVETTTQRLDSIYSRMSTAYLGKYTDKEFGNFAANFITQINCPENFRLDNLVSIDSVYLELFYDKYYGDSLAAMKLAVDTLSHKIENQNSDKALHYTNFNPDDYYNKQNKPLAEKIFTPVDLSVKDSLRALSSYQKNVTIYLGDDFGKHLTDKYKSSNGSFFKDADTFNNNVLKGFYVHITQGEGAMLYINNIALQMRINYHVKSSTQQDSLVHRYVMMVGTREVYMSTQFANNTPDYMLENDTKTYLRSPAGLYTEVKLKDLQAMYDKHYAKDTLNAASLSFLRYRNDKDVVNPPYVLLVRKSEINRFFEQDKVADNKTSFLATYDSSTNSYTFSKLNRLLSVLFEEIKNNGGKVKADSNMDKLVLLPVTVTETVNSNNQKTIIAVNHDLEVTSTAFDKGSVKMNLIYTTPRK